MSINNLKTPIGNTGRIGSVSNNYVTFDDQTILWCSGFFLAGKDADSLWANGQYHIYDYLPGPVGSNKDNPLHKIYVVKSSDAEFGQSWQEWMNAVDLGAKFYDGENDGLYNPVDHNNNGKWDINEDRPDLIGDYTAWFVINDGVPSVDKWLNFNQVNPKGIEIKITVFATASLESEPLGNTIFIRYIVENIGSVSELFDSVYFGIMADSDIGYPQDDFMSFDSIRNASVTYNNGEDEYYGDDPPALLSDILMGPHSFIAGKSFIDNNNNGSYEIETDIPLDTAFYNQGPFLGVKKIPGAANLPPTAFTGLIKSTWDFGNPGGKEDVLNYLKGGMSKNGSTINVCELYYGNGSELDDCDAISNKYMYSGDPVTGEGWLYNYSYDVRCLIPMGPFKLKKGEPVEIMISHSAGRGADAINSIAIAREIDDYIQVVYDNNFEDLPVSVIHDVSIPEAYLLSQNHPNPFNPSTTISYSIPANGKVTLKVYDILGKEVTTLVNESKDPGVYHADFNANNLSSGTYIYQIIVNAISEGGRGYSASMKMLLIK